MHSGSQLNYALWKKKYNLLLVLELSLDDFIWSPLGLVLQETVNEHSLFIFSTTLLYRFLSFSSLAISLPGWRFLIYLIALSSLPPISSSIISPFFPHPSFKYKDQNCTQRSRQEHTLFIDWHSRFLFCWPFFSLFLPSPEHLTNAWFTMVSSLQHRFLWC